MIQTFGVLLTLLGTVPLPSSYPVGSPSPAHATDRVAQQQVGLERLARDYRIRVYQTFRQRRPELEHRRDAWTRVLASWQVAGSRPEHLDRLIDWLQTATRNSTAGTLAPLPEDPRFDTRADPPPLIAQPRVDPIVIRSKAPEAPLPRPSPALVVPKRQRAAPAITTRRPADRAGSAVAIARPPAPARPSRASPPEPLRPEIVAPRSTPLHRRATPPASPWELPSETSRREAAAPLRSQHDRRPVGPELPAEESFARPPVQARMPAATPLVRAKQPATLPGGRLQDSLPTAPLTRRAAPPSQASPRLADTRTSPLPSRPRATLRPSSENLPADVEDPPPIPAPDLQAAPRVQVNRAELAARIAGGNLALGALEADLGGRRRWTAGRLAPLVERLDLLALRRADYLLLYELIPQPDRAFVGRFEPIGPVIGRLERLVAKARSAAQSPDFNGTQAARAAELKRLDQISRTLEAADRRR